MRENPFGSTPPKNIPSSLRYLPATLVSVFLAALLAAFPGATDWAQPGMFALFLKAKGPPAPSLTTVIVTGEAAPGMPDRAAVARLARAIMNQHPAALAIDLPANWPSGGTGATAGSVSDPVGSDAGESLPSGSIIIGHDFTGFKSSTFTDAVVQVHGPLVSHSLYPLLDGPGGPDLPTGEGLRLSDSLWKSTGLSTGFRSLSKTPIITIPAFARLGRGVVANFAVEAARRTLGVSAEKVAFVEGVGALLGQDHVVPLDGHGVTAVRFYAHDGISRIAGASLLDGSLPKDALRGKLVFLDPGYPSPQVPTAVGRMPSAELWANAAANLLDRSTLSLPSWGGTLAVTLGVLFAVVAGISVFLEFSGAAIFGLAVLLGAAFPLLSLAVFMTTSSWLPPVLPPLMVAAVYIPFTLSRLVFPARNSLRTIPPGPAYEQVLVSIAPDSPRVTGALPVMAMTPGRGTPRVNANAATPQNQNPIPPPPPRPRAPMERAAAGVPDASPSPAPSRFVDPRDPPILPTPSHPQASHAPAAAPSPTPAAPAPRAPARAVAAPAHTGNIADDIERDSKGGLVRVGKYRIIRKMGFGSAGDVFEGLDTHMGRKVAIKTITKNAPSHFDRAAERFVLEAKAAGSLNHPCINTVYDFGTVREVSYMVLEYLDGITLSQWMRNNPTPPRPDVVSHWLEQICSAMDYAHSHKVIHRDLKPSNLMIVNNGATIKLLDFGIAKIDDVGLTQTGMTVGTPSYMSPEQLSGLKVGPTSDQYGLAVVIYQLFTYKLPYLGTKIPELCNRILKNDLVPITDANPSLGAAFWEALRKGLAKTPEDRYPSCMAMCQALEASFPNKNPT